MITDTEFGSAGLGSPKLHPRSEVGRVSSVLFAPHLFHYVFVLDRQALGVPVTDFPDVVVRLWSGAQVDGDLENQPGFITLTEFDQLHPGLLSKKDSRRVGESPVLLAFFRVASVCLSSRSRSYSS